MFPLLYYAILYSGLVSSLYDDYNDLYLSDSSRSSYLLFSSGSYRFRFWRAYLVEVILDFPMCNPLGGRRTYIKLCDLLSFPSGKTRLKPLYKRQHPLYNISLNSQGEAKELKSRSTSNPKRQGTQKPRSVSVSLRTQ